MSTKFKPQENYRPGVGIVIRNRKGQLWVGKLLRWTQWQFPQGGIEPGESPEQAMYRELREETGLLPNQVKIIAESKKWTTYKYPFNADGPLAEFTGARHRWFFLQLLDDNAEFDLTQANEFSDYRWVNYWYPIRNVVYFKEEVYRKVLKEFARFAFKRRPRF